jgi:hypothetical protein
VSVVRVRELMARARAGEFANETARREAFATILPDLVGFSGGRIRGERLLVRTESEFNTLRHLAQLALGNASEEA